MSSPRIFKDLTAPARHGESPLDVENAKKAAEAARAKGAFVVDSGEADGIARTTSASRCSTASRRRTAAAPRRSRQCGAACGAAGNRREDVWRWCAATVRAGPTQCHDITVYPGIGYAGGACEGYGLLLDIRDPAHPVRIGAAADSNFSYWHSATFNNDGTKVLFSDEWGGGGQPKCRATDKREWGADALFTIENGKMVFQGYYKLPAPQTNVGELRRAQRFAHSDPGPRRDGAGVVSGRHLGLRLDGRGASKEIAFFDRGPVDSTRSMSVARGRCTGTTA